MRITLNQKAMTMCVFVFAGALVAYGQTPISIDPVSPTPVNPTPVSPTPVSPTQPSLTGWQLQVKGSIYSGTDTGNTATWIRQNYETATTGDVGTSLTGYMNSHMLQASAYGVITVRRKWYGPGTPTTYPNFKIHSSAFGEYYGSEDAVSIDNGFTTASSPAPQFNQVTADNNKLIQPGKSLDAETYVSVSLNGSGSSYAQIEVTVG